jgi:hypothetical protein
LAITPPEAKADPQRAFDQHVNNLMISAGWLPDPDWTTVVPLESVTVSVTFNGVSVPAIVAPGPPQLCVNEKFGLVPVWMWLIVPPYR